MPEAGYFHDVPRGDNFTYLRLADNGVVLLAYSESDVKAEVRSMKYGAHTVNRC